MGGINRFRKDIEKNINSLFVEKETFRNVVTGKLYEIMEREKINKVELSEKMEVSKPAITNLLSGDRNFTIDKLIELSSVLGYYPEIDFFKKGERGKNLFIKYFAAKKNITEIRYFEGEIDSMKVTEESVKMIELYAETLRQIKPGYILSNGI